MIGANFTTATGKPLTAQMLLDAAERLKVYKPTVPRGYVFGPRAENMLRNLDICRLGGYESLLGVPCWIDQDMVGTDVECYYDQALLDLRVTALAATDKARAKEKEA